MTVQSFLLVDAVMRKHIPYRPSLQREQHYIYLKRGLRHLSDAYECLDASRPWLCYWILHSLELLDESVPSSVASDVCKFLARCQSPSGGFAGGPGQHPHLAPTYAAVNALCIIGTEEAYNVIDRQKLLDFLYSLKQPDGSFIMHMGGEVDVRSAYCAASVASLTNIITAPLFEGTPSWITRCQNWEGGLGGVPGLEAHGGYTFCGMAAMVILQKEHMLDLKSLSRDFYHTCYCLSGLSIAQHFGSREIHHEVIVGKEENRLAPTHPVYNICPDKVAQAVQHFHQMAVPGKSGSSSQTPNL
ncbi:UNVERIFIED_CONTAM: hypothetical protein FKN15_038448 [Acipenser sinensis]